MFLLIHERSRIPLQVVQWIFQSFRRTESLRAWHQFLIRIRYHILIVDFLLLCLREPSLCLLLELRLLLLLLGLLLWLLNQVWVGWILKIYGLIVGLRVGGIGHGAMGASVVGVLEGRWVLILHGLIVGVWLLLPVEVLVGIFRHSWIII